MTVVVQVETLPQTSVADHVIIEMPVLKDPLASLPEPVLAVTPVTSYAISADPAQLSATAIDGGIKNILD